MFIRQALALSLALLASHSMAASFDCTKASNYAEREICRDGYLSGIDGTLARAYKAALEVAESPDAVRQSQREWLATRNQCTTQQCLDKALGGRIKALEDFTRTQKLNALEAAQLQRTAELRAQEAERTRQAEAAFAAQEQARQQRLEAAREQHNRTSSQPATSPQASTYATSPQTPAQHQLATPASPPSAWQKFINGPAWKYFLLTCAGLSCWAMWRHHRQQATIYNDYTDAAITNLLPAAGVLVGFICKWLEMPAVVFQVAAGTGFVLAVMFAVYASFRSNQGALNIVLTLIAKLTLISVFYAVIALLVASLFSSNRYKGESQARANARNRREKKRTVALIAALSTAYTYLTAWLCRRPEFTPLSTCLAFAPPPQAA